MCQLAGIIASTVNQICDMRALARKVDMCTKPNVKGILDLLATTAQGRNYAALAA